MIVYIFELLELVSMPFPTNTFVNYIYHQVSLEGVDQSQSKQVVEEIGGNFH